MKYEFHVGDYVETVTGLIGWVSNVDRNYITIKSNTGITSGPWSIPNEQYHFNRIGQYDFTDCDVGDIEPLLIEKPVNMYCGDGKTNSPSDYRRVARQDEFNDKVIKKINELVETVNQLEEKVNEMAQS